MREEAQGLLNEFLFQTAIVRDQPGYEVETKLIETLEEMSWGIAAEDFAKLHMPTSYMTQDRHAAAEGIRAPPHVMIDANVMAVQSRLQAVGEFCVKSRRVLRQIQAKVELRNADPSAPRLASADLLRRICSGFHRAARQLLKRHKGRSTIKIGDEYDVQDLLHSFLVLHFDDVRPEEYTPSYAGGSARMDFLLKRERIVVEVKRTRDGLGAKEVGDQLAVDIARYRSHPDCRLLLCFVYDPEGRISNPRGLESDLAALANPELKVVVLVEPN